ncbi:unnamed protein product [Polarella glacialis]|uniref:J domain-containing protein n=1 Tax=Polarella glacialis TaxID=89957 RepID=A0A813HY72_POLGL|nr:unnamed protein product [Polarella glacialis]
MAGTLLNFYGALGIDESASESDVRSAYRRRALATHPDKGGEAEVFRLVVQAFELLADPPRRLAYDHKLRLLRGADGQGHGKCTTTASSSAAAPAAPAAAQASRAESVQQTWGLQSAGSRPPHCSAEAKQQQAPSQGETLQRGGRSAATGAQPASTSEDCEAGYADGTTAEEILLKLMEMRMQKAAARTLLQELSADVLRQLVALLSSDVQPGNKEPVGACGLPRAAANQDDGSFEVPTCVADSSNAESEPSSSDSDADCHEPEPLHAICDAVHAKKQPDSPLPGSSRMRGVNKMGRLFVPGIGIEGVFVRSQGLPSLDSAIDMHISLVRCRQLVNMYLDQGMDLSQAFSRSVNTVKEERRVSGATPMQLTFDVRPAKGRRVYFKASNFDAFIVTLSTVRSSSRKRCRTAEDQSQKHLEDRLKRRRWLKELILSLQQKALLSRWGVKELPAGIELATFVSQDDCVCAMFQLFNGTSRSGPFRKTLAQAQKDLVELRELQRTLGDQAACDEVARRDIDAMTAFFMQQASST